MSFLLFFLLNLYSPPAIPYRASWKVILPAFMITFHSCTFRPSRRRTWHLNSYLPFCLWVRSTGSRATGAMHSGTLRRQLRPNKSDVVIATRSLAYCQHQRLIVLTQLDHRQVQASDIHLHQTSRIGL